MIKKILIAFAVILLIIQFIRPEKNIAAAPSDANIATHYTTPDNVKKILERSCNDCHSNTTKYPWYASIQPVGWWLADHVKEGKSELNFDAFMTYKPKKARHKMEEVNEMVKRVKCHCQVIPLFTAMPNSQKKTSLSLLIGLWLP